MSLSSAAHTVASRGNRVNAPTRCRNSEKCPSGGPSVGCGHHLIRFALSGAATCQTRAANRDELSRTVVGCACSHPGFSAADGVCRATRRTIGGSRRDAFGRPPFELETPSNRHRLTRSGERGQSIRCDIAAGATAADFDITAHVEPQKRFRNTSRNGAGGLGALVAARSVIVAGPETFWKRLDRRLATVLHQIGRFRRGCSRQRRHPRTTGSTEWPR